jgi:purine nucleosidase
MSYFAWRFFVGVLASIALSLVVHAAVPIPVVFDTDIGTDIDDAYALALIVRSPELKLVGVTTVSGDAVARARLAAKLLSTAGDAWRDVPVYAGTSTAAQYMAQTDWAAGFSSPALHLSGGVEFLRQQIDAHPGEITIIAVGELTNVAALLAAEPGIGAKIKGIALMGGSVKRGYAPGSPPEPEWNIKSNAAAARAVFTSGVPLLVAPLDATSGLRLDEANRVKIFSSGTPLNDALASLDFIWRHTNTWKGDIPVLHDVLAVALVSAPQLATLTPLHLDIADNGLTKLVVGEKANATVALAAEPVAFLHDFSRRLSEASPAH